jgi:hypothetical protein
MLVACGEEGTGVGELPAPASATERPPEPTAAPAPRDPRIPPGFDLPLPREAVARYGQSSAERASLLVTTERDPAEVLDELSRAWAERGWRVEPRAEAHARPPGRWRDAVDAFEAGSSRRVASAVVSRGCAGITRVLLEQPLEDGAPFHAAPEPRAWRRIDRPPLPAPPGTPSRECAAAIRRACEALAAAGGPDALDCALDHRGVCVPTDAAPYLERAVEDAEARLRAALEAHDRVGSRGARAETAAQVALELLAAKANAMRAPDGGALATPIGEAEAEGHAVDVAPDEMAGWFLQGPQPPATPPLRDVPREISSGADP